MNQNYQKSLGLNFSGTGCWLSVLLIFFLLGSVGLGWIVNSVLIIIGLVLLTPIIAWLGLNWWLKRNLIEDQCPVCSYTFVGFNQRECHCPNCGESLKVENKKFVRLSPPGTIDVEAVEVQVQQLED